MGVGVWVWEIGSVVSVWGLGFRGVGVRVQGSGFRVQGSGFKVWGLRCTRVPRS